MSSLDAVVDGLHLVLATIDVAEGDRVDLVESNVEVGEEGEVVELEKTSDFRCPLQEKIVKVKVLDRFQGSELSINTINTKLVVPTQRSLARHYLFRTYEKMAVNLPGGLEELLN